ncbi:MAG: hypothetical protein ACP5QO_15805, partial [Clostridia bacterium]
ATLRAAQQVLATASDAAGAALGRGREALTQATEVLETVLTQTRHVLAGATHLSDRVVSVFDPTVRPIVKSKVGKPVEFGYKVAIDEVDHGFIVGWETAVGNRPDIRFLPRALDRHRRLFRRAPREAAMDRGYWDADTVADLDSRNGERSRSRARRSNANPGSGGCNAGGRGRAHRVGQTTVSAAAQPVSGETGHGLVGGTGDPGCQPGVDAAPRAPTVGRRLI